MRYNKIEAKFKSRYIESTFLSAFFYAVLLSVTMVCQLGKATESAILFIYLAIVFALGS